MSSAATPQERIVDEARNVLERLDAAREWHAERDNKTTVKQIDLAIGATLSLRSAVRDYDKAVGRESTI